MKNWIPPGPELPIDPFLQNPKLPLSLFFTKLASHHFVWTGAVSEWHGVLRAGEEPGGQVEPGGEEPGGHPRLAHPLLHGRGGRALPPHRHQVLPRLSCEWKELISNHTFRCLDNNCELVQSRHLVKISDMVNPVVTWLSVISLALLNPIYIFNLATWFFHSNLQKLKPFFWLHMLQQGVGKQHWIRGHGLLLKHHWDSCPLLRFQNTRGVRNHSLKFCRIFWHVFGTKLQGIEIRFSVVANSLGVRGCTAERVGSTRWDGELVRIEIVRWWNVELEVPAEMVRCLYLCSGIGGGKIGLDEQCFKVSGSEHNILCTLEDIHLTSSESHVSSLTSRVRICLTMFWEVLISIETHSILFVHVIYVIGHVGAFVWDRHQFNLKTYHKIDFWNIFVIS